MRGMIGCYCVNRSIAQPFEQCLHMIAATQRRIHLRIRIVVSNRFIGKSPVMRRDFAAYVQSSFLRSTNCFDRTTSRYVRKVYFATSDLG